MATIPPNEIQYELENTHDNRAPNIIVSYTVCLSLAFIAVALRFVARRVSKASLRADDWWIVISLVYSLQEMLHFIH